MHVTNATKILKNGVYVFSYIEGENLEINSLIKQNMETRYKVR